MSLSHSENVPARRSIAHEAREEHRKQSYDGGEFHDGNKNEECSRKDGGG